MSYAYNPFSNELDLYKSAEEMGALKAANNLSDVADAETSFDNIKQASTEDNAGVLETATDIEAAAKAETDKALVPSNLPTVYDNIVVSNDVWIKADNAASTNEIPMFKANTDDEIDIGAILNVGPIEAEADFGAVILFDMPVTADPVAGTEESAALKIDGNTFIKLYAEADSAGSIQNKKAIIKQKLSLEQGTTGGILNDVLEATVDITAAASITLSVNVPSGSKLIGAQMRVDSALATGETWIAEWNDGASLQNIVTDAAVVKNTKANKFHDDNANTPLTDAVTDIVITKTGGGNFTAQGTIRAIVYYQGFNAMNDLV